MTQLRNFSSLADTADDHREDNEPTDILLDELTDAAYQTVLRFDPSATFLDRQLQLWAALRSVVHGRSLSVASAAAADRRVAASPRWLTA